MSAGLQSAGSLGDADVLAAKTVRLELDVTDGGAMAFDVAALIPPDRPRRFLAVRIPADGATRTAWPGVGDREGGDGLDGS